MELSEILKTKLNDLYKQLKKLEKSIKSDESMYESLNQKRQLITDVLVNMDSIGDIRNQDTSKVSYLLVNSGYFDNMELLENNLREIKVILKAIHDKKLRTALTNNQNELVKNYMLACRKLYESLTSKCDNLENDCLEFYQDKDKLEEKIVAVEVLLEKINSINNESVLDKDDYDLILELSKDPSIEVGVRKDALVKFIEYNEDRKNGVKKVITIDIDKLKELFARYGINPAIDRKIDKYITTVEEKGNLKNVESILEYMKENDILNRFDVVNLLTICLFGNIDSVRSEYESIKDRENTYIFYATPSAWISNITRTPTKRRTYSKRGEGDTVRDPLKELANLVSSKELDDNIALLKKEGFKFEEQDGGAIKALYMPNYKLKENINALKQYGVVTPENVGDFKVWLLAEGNLIDKLDKSVELGLLNGVKTSHSLSNYIKRYPSKLHNLEYTDYLVLYEEKQYRNNIDDYYETIESKKSGQLSGYVTAEKCGFLLHFEEQIEDFINKKFVKPESIVEGFDVYDMVLSNTYNVSIDPSIMNEPEIMNLEENYKVNDYIYNFDGVYISRLKVLRNYSLIGKSGNDGLLASIMRNSFLKANSLNKIMKSINYTLGGNDGISRAI